MSASRAKRQRKTPVKTDEKSTQPGGTEVDKEKSRCFWAGSDAVYIDYHDNEWGQPLHGDDRLFEMLSLEGQQAGLSWIAILKRREGYREAFMNFEIEKVASLTAKDIDSIIAKGKVIRHRGKLESIVNNAKQVLQLKKDTGRSFDEFVWSFKPATKRTPKGVSIADEAMKFHEALKGRGFSFVGPTICHAYFQAIGLLNDHSDSCFLFKDDE